MKGVFKSIIAILRFYKNCLIGKDFDRLMESFTDLLKHEIFKNSLYEDYVSAKACGLDEE